jgi:hypothetical protein
MDTDDVAGGLDVVESCARVALRPVSQAVRRLMPARSAIRRGLFV